MPTQEQLLQLLISGALGPWAGQGLTPNGITILRPDTMQWETITADAEDADLMHSVLSDPVQASSTWSDPTRSEQQMVDEYLQGMDPGITATSGVTSSMPGGSFGHALASVVTASTYSNADFVRTELGDVRLNHGDSNGATGPLSPILLGSGLTAVDKDGNKWLPEVRFKDFGEGQGPGGVAN